MYAEHAQTHMFSEDVFSAIKIGDVRSAKMDSSNLSINVINHFGDIFMSL